VGKQLSFVVARAAPIQIVTVHSGIERTRTPIVNGFCRLDVIVAINEHRRPTTGAQPFAVNEGMTFSGHDVDALDSDSL